MQKDNRSNTTEKQANPLTKHIALMGVCCGLPILLAFSVPLLGIRLGSVEAMLPLLCPILMVGMCGYMMIGSKKDKDASCCSDKTEEESPQLPKSKTSPTNLSQASE